jgi:hypothetical protein
VDLAGIPKPFLTAQDDCTWSERIEGESLTFAPGGSSRPLYVSADDQGHQAKTEPIPGHAPCSIIAVEPRLMQGPMTEQHLDQLRALGYFLDE